MTYRPYHDLTEEDWNQYWYGSRNPFGNEHGSENKKSEVEVEIKVSKGTKVKVKVQEKDKS